MKNKTTKFSLIFSFLFFLLSVGNILLTSLFYSSTNYWRVILLLLSVIAVFFISKYLLTQQVCTATKITEKAFHLENVIEGTDELILALDINYNVKVVNSSYRQVFKKLLRKDIEVGSNLMKLLEEWPEKRESATNMLQGAFKGETIVVAWEYMIGGAKVLFELKNNPLKDREGKVIGVVQFIKDITEQRLIETALRESDERFHVIAKATKDIIWDLDLSSYKIWWNEALENQFGYPIKEMENYNLGWVSDKIHPEDREKVSKSLEDAVMVTSNFWSEEYRFRKNDNNYAFIFDRGYILYNDKGEAVRIIGAMQDVTERKISEQALLESEELFRQVAENVDVVIWMREYDSLEMVYVSPAVEKVWGVLPEEALADAHLFFQTIYPEDREKLQKSFFEKIKGGEYKEEYRIIRKDNEVRWVYTNTFVIKDSQGKPIRILGLTQDITERKKSEEAIKLSELRLNLLIRNSSTGVILVSADGKVLYEGPANKSIMGYDKEERLNANAFETIHPDHLDFALKNFREVILEEGGTRSMVLQTRHKSGDWRWVEASATNLLREPLIDALVVHFWDITEEKSKEAKIVELNNQLEQRVKERTSQLEIANKELEAFCYSVSHDLRSPLRAIEGFSKILGREYRGRLDEEAERIIAVISRNVGMMSQLIEDLLSFSRLSKEKIVKEAIDMNGLVDLVIQELKAGDFKDSEAEVKVGVLPVVMADLSLIKQVWLNLINNAFKYSSQQPKSIVEIGAINRNGRNIYFVRDNGIGFNMKYADKLFGVFERLHKDLDFEGTGVGLAIVQRIVLSHGGKIWAESEEGKGASFYFYL